MICTVTTTLRSLLLLLETCKYYMKRPDPANIHSQKPPFVAAALAAFAAAATALVYRLGYTPLVVVHESAVLR